MKKNDNFHISSQGPYFFNFSAAFCVPPFLLKVYPVKSYWMFRQTVLSQPDSFNFYSNSSFSEFEFTQPLNWTLHKFNMSSATGNCLCWLLRRFGETSSFYLIHFPRVFQSDNMTDKWHVYMTKDGRISLAGLSSAKCEYLADAIIDSFHNVS